MHTYSKLLVVGVLYLPAVFCAPGSVYGRKPYTHTRGHTLHPRQDSSDPSTSLAAAQTDADAVKLALTASPFAFSQTNSTSFIDPHDGFLFDNPNYFALQQYVITGLKQIRSEHEFSTLFDRTEFQAQVSDQRLYDDSMKCLPAIYSHCLEFWSSTIGQMSLFSMQISSFAQTAAEAYAAMVEQIDIVSNEDRGSDAWTDALYTLNAWSSEIQTSLVVAKKQCDTIEAAIVEFQTNTTADTNTALDISTRFTTEYGNLVDDYNKAHDAVRDMTAAISVQAANEVKFERQLKATKGYAWEPPVGWILSAIYIPKLKNKIKVANDQISEDYTKRAKANQDEIVINEVLGVLKDFQGMTTDVLKYAQGAVDNIATARNAFDSMDVSIQKILDQTSNMVDESYDGNNWIFDDTEFGQALNASALAWTVVVGQASSFQSKAQIYMMTEQEAADQLAGIGSFQDNSLAGPFDPTDDDNLRRIV